MKEIRIVFLATVPVALVWTLSWFGVFTFVNAYIIKGLKYTNAEWSAISLWFVGGTVLWQIFATEISARFGRRRTIFAAMIVTALIWTVIGFIKSKAVMGLLLAVIGFMPACTSVVWYPMVAEIGRHQPGRALAGIQIIATITTVLTMLLGGYLVAGDNFHLIFIPCGLLCAFCAAAFYLITLPLQNAENEHIVSLFRLQWPDIRAMAKSSFPALIIMGICIEPFSFHTINQLFPNLARDMHGLTESNIGSIVALGRLPALLSLFILARYIDRLVPAICYGIGIILAGMAVVFTGMAGNIFVLICGYIFFYIGQGTVWGSNSASINAAVEARLRDSAFALMSVFMIAAVFGVGYVHNLLIRLGTSLSGVFVGCGLTAICGGMALVIFSTITMTQKRLK